MRFNFIFQVSYLFYPLIPVVRTEKHVQKLHHVQFLNIVILAVAGLSEPFQMLFSVFKILDGKHWYSFSWTVRAYPWESVRLRYWGHGFDSRARVMPNSLKKVVMVSSLALSYKGLALRMIFRQKYRIIGRVLVLVYLTVARATEPSRPLSYPKSQHHDKHPAKAIA